MSGPFEEFDHQLDLFFERLRDGSASAADIAELEKLLHSDPALRQRYRARVRMEEDLSAAFEEPSDVVLPFETEAKRPWHHSPMAWTAIAAGIAMMAGIFLTNRKDSPPATVATLDSWSSASWESPLVLADGSRVAPGEVSLKSGIARFRFDSGALVTLEGPASLAIETEMRARLLDGKALVEAPESAHGFVIVLPHGETVDLGTRFSVKVADDAATCEVLEGRVLMRHGESQQEEFLDHGQVMTLNRAGITPLGYRPSLNFAPGSEQPLVLRTSAEATVVSSNLRYRFVDDRMLLVKMEPDSSMQRRVLFNIDLGTVKGSSIQSAKLNLNLVPSGLGFAAYLPETVTFAVYGITDETRESWNSANPRWEQVPGFVAGDASAVNPSDVTLLGKFEINRGQQRGQCTIETAELREFLRKDTTGTAGFLIVRETYGTGDYSLVHAFASSHHPEASGPSLEVKLAD